MATVARIKENDLLLLGEADERLPVVTDGLVSSFPMDNTVIGESLERILPYENWIIGTDGSQPFFTSNGLTYENHIIEDLDPWGKPIAIWQGLGNDVASAADGGWITSTFPVDETKIYRFTCWMKRVVTGNGRWYFGTHGYPNPVLYRTTGAANSNPYFMSSDSQFVPLGDWMLMVGHIHSSGSGTGANLADSGGWAMNGTKLLNGTDYTWAVGTTSANQRTYLYYSTDATTDIRWCYPKVEVVDGSEPTIQQMVTGHVHGLNPTTSKVRYIRDWLNGSTSNTSNHIVELQAIDYFGTNVALGKTATSSTTLSNGTLITDGNTATNPYASFGTGLQWIQVDLGSLYNLKAIKVYHYYSDGRTYHETKTEVSTDGVTWRAVFDSAIEGEYAEPTNGTGKVHQKISPNTVTPDGVAIEEVTTNYLSDGINGYNAANIDHWVGISSYVFNYELARNVISWDSASGSYIYTNDLVLDDDLGTLSAQTVTFSLMIRRVEGSATGSIRVYDNISGHSSFNVDVTQDFQLVQGTKTLGTSPTRIFVMIDNTGGGTYEFYDAQLETKSFATSYVNGSRVGNGSLQIPMNNLSPTKGSFVMEFSATPYEYSPTVYTDCLDFRNVTLDNNRFLIMRKAATKLTPNQIFIRDGATWRNVSNTNITAGRNIIAWTWDIASGYDVYLNDIVILTGGTFTESDIDFSEVNFRAGIEIHNLSTYNTKLTTAQLVSLTKNALSIKPSGDIKNEILERAIIPTGATYFPLGADGKDEGKYITPTIENNIVYEDNSVWIGAGTSNSSLNNGQISSPWGGDGSPTLSIVDPDVTFRDRKVIRYHPGTSGNCYLGGTADLSNGTLSTDWAVTYYIKRVDKVPITSIGNYLYITSNTNVNIGVTPVEVEDGWYKVTRDRTGLVSGYPTLTGLYSMADTDYYIANWQVEPHSYQTPVVDGSRASSSLAYDPTELINFQEGTMACWFKPTDGFFESYSWNRVFGHSTATNYNEIQVLRNSIGNNLGMTVSNSSGSPQTTLANCPSGTIYANQWYCVIARWNFTSGFMSLTVNGVKNEQALTVTYQPTVKGTLAVGYHPTTIRLSNSYIKDFIVLDRAITDIEADAMYNTKMRQTIDSINISNAIIEGVL